MDGWMKTISEDMRKHKCSEEQIRLVLNEYRGHVQNIKDFRRAEEYIKTYGRDGYLVYRYKDTIKVRKGYKTFKTENKNLSEAEVLALTDIWWRGLMMSVVASNTKNNDDTEGIHGFDN